MFVQTFLAYYGTINIMVHSLQQDGTRTWYRQLLTMDTTKNPFTHFLTASLTPTLAPSQPIPAIPAIRDTLVIGICLGLLGSVCINLGNNLQSLGMTQLEMKQHNSLLQGHLEDPEKEIKSIRKKIRTQRINTCESRLWIFGTVVFLTGSLLTFAAFAFAPQSILASLEGKLFTLLT